MGIPKTRTRFGPGLARAGIATLAILLLASPAVRADATLFLGSTPTPSGRLARGWAVGAGLVLVGFEFEYSSTVEDTSAAAPSLTTGMGNVYAQTPFGTVQFYALVGAGVYRERLDQAQETNLATAAGGGAKIGLAGPLRLRVDYRVFNLRGAPRYERVHRVYLGLNLLF